MSPAVVADTGGLLCALARKADWTPSFPDYETVGGEVRLKPDATIARRSDATIARRNACTLWYVVSGFSRTKSLRQVEVEYLHRAVRPHLDVRWFEIAVNDALFVRGFERLRNLPRDRERFFDV